MIPDKHGACVMVSAVALIARTRSFMYYFKMVRCSRIDPIKLITDNLDCCMPVAPTNFYLGILQSGGICMQHHGGSSSHPLYYHHSFSHPPRHQLSVTPPFMATPIHRIAQEFFSITAQKEPTAWKAKIGSITSFTPEKLNYDRQMSP